VLADVQEGELDLVDTGELGHPGGRGQGDLGLFRVSGTRIFRRSKPPSVFTKLLAPSGIRSTGILALWAIASAELLAKNRDSALR
jgi:hypothetical protein